MGNRIYRSVASFWATAAVALMAFAMLACSTPAQEKEQPKLSKQAKKSPLKVFILAGQSNMLGYGIVSEKDKSGRELKGTLAWMLKDPAKAPLIKHLFDGKGKPVVRDDVWVDNAGRFPNPNRGALSLVYGCNDDNFGPEVGFGQVMGDALQNQVLIIKAAWGGRSLYKDFRPPSSGGTVGPTYLQMINTVKESLAELKKRFPAYDGGGYELSGFVWWHGWNDHIDACNHEYERGPAEYEQNLLNLVRDVPQRPPRAEHAFRDRRVPRSLRERLHGRSSLRDDDPQGAGRGGGAARVLRHSRLRADA